ncbi:hypothetical protein [Brevibacillus centrosporus]|uniref:Uncharacterized protein n=1 Tax=Brevibacillus centrosporus TaxID=54910 RepID=A0A1I3ZN21_9BACL|nr:hypothetical protein [Brevibacillus centrosporus]MED4911658.1 hypothetical protein [Brevibacillus centrosporus]SFK45340.1 hypothetical protein SAMN05518846_113164 [Brevibacillus centrosporus]
MQIKVLTGALWRDEAGWLYLLTLLGDRYEVIEPQTITLTETLEKVQTDELEEYHYGMHVIASCVIN